MNSFVIFFQSLFWFNRDHVSTVPLILRTFFFCKNIYFTKIKLFMCQNIEIEIERKGEWIYSNDNNNSNNNILSTTLYFPLKLCIIFCNKCELCGILFFQLLVIYIVRVKYVPISLNNTWAIFHIPMCSLFVSPTIVCLCVLWLTAVYFMFLLDCMPNLHFISFLMLRNMEHGV